MTTRTYMQEVLTVLAVIDLVMFAFGLVLAVIGVSLITNAFHSGRREIGESTSTSEEDGK